MALLQMISPIDNVHHHFQLTIRDLSVPWLKTIASRSWNKLGALILNTMTGTGQGRGKLVRAQFNLTQRTSRCQWCDVTVSHSELTDRKSDGKCFIRGLIQRTEPVRKTAVSCQWFSADGTMCISCQYQHLFGDHYLSRHSYYITMENDKIHVWTVVQLLVFCFVLLSFLQDYTCQ